MMPDVLSPKPTRHLARLTFVAFLFTFIASRVLVILIMSRRLPDLFLHLGGTHVHHLNTEFLRCRRSLACCSSRD
jgi:hypothetical protein